MGVLADGCRIGRRLLDYRFELKPKEGSDRKQLGEVATGASDGQFAAGAISEGGCLPMDSLAQRIKPVAEWGDLALPDEGEQTLRKVIAHVEELAGSRSAAGEVCVVLTGGRSEDRRSTAEVLAGELCLDVYRIDLSQVVNKYIGETEKSLSRLFEHAERSDFILFFDEADALFGKRSEGRDSDDLLERIEGFPGLVILGTNRRQKSSEVFTHRMSYLVEFPVSSQG